MELKPSIALARLAMLDPALQRELGGHSRFPSKPNAGFKRGRAARRCAVADDRNAAAKLAGCRVGTACGVGDHTAVLRTQRIAGKIPTRLASPLRQRPFSKRRHVV